MKNWTKAFLVSYDSVHRIDKLIFHLSAVPSSGELVAVLETISYSVVDEKEVFMTVCHLQCEKTKTFPSS